MMSWDILGYVILKRLWRSKETINAETSKELIVPNREIHEEFMRIGILCSILKRQRSS